MSARRALVLGGGFAGLSAAIRLALAGADVTLLEREPETGGKAAEVRADGYRWDAGPSVVTLPGVLRAPFEAAGRELGVRLEPLDPLCRYRFPSGRVLDVHRDVERTVAQMSAREGRAYRRLLERARTLYEGAAPTFVHGPAPGPLALLRYGLRHGLRAAPGRSLAGLVRAAGPGEELEPFFLRFATYLGADPYRAPAVLHNIAWVELGLGSVAPAGGVAALRRAFDALARELGADIRTGATVERIVRRGARVVGVVADGAFVAADAVVSALDVARTRALLDPAGARALSDPARAGAPSSPARGRPSLSGLVLLLGVEGRAPELAVHTIDFPRDYRAEFRAVDAGRHPDDPTVYLHASCRVDPADAPPGHDNLFVMANAPALPAGADPDGAAILADEARAAERLERVLERRGLLEPGRVRARFVRGPSLLARYGERGSIYGAAPDSLFAALRPGPRLRGVERLALAGGTVHPGGGVPLAVLSGEGAARLAARDLGLTRPR